MIASRTSFVWGEIRWTVSETCLRMSRLMNCWHICIPCEFKSHNHEGHKGSQGETFPGIPRIIGKIFGCEFPLCTFVFFVVNDSTLRRETLNQIAPVSSGI